jgi:hypothetical protein
MRESLLTPIESKQVPKAQFEGACDVEHVQSTAAQRGRVLSTQIRSSS